MKTSEGRVPHEQGPLRRFPRGKALAIVDEPTLIFDPSSLPKEELVSLEPTELSGSYLDPTLS
jgi:hypothetical protein